MTKACTTIVLPFSFIINIKYNNVGSKTSRDGISGSSK